MYNNEFLQNMNMENIVDGNNNYINNDMNGNSKNERKSSRGITQQDNRFCFSSISAVNLYSIIYPFWFEMSFPSQCSFIIL